MTDRKSQPWIWKGLSLIYLAFFLTTLYLAYTKQLPVQFSHIPYYDKIGHVVLYFIPTYLGHRVLNYRRISMRGVRVPLFPLLFTIFTVTEECIQAFSPNRTFDLLDLFLSCCGIGLGYFLAERGKS
jgi:VanZ family protein